jgi:carboxylesterase type B
MFQTTGRLSLSKLDTVRPYGRFFIHSKSLSHTHTHTHTHMPTMRIHLVILYVTITVLYITSITLVSGADPLNRLTNSGLIRGTTLLNNQVYAWRGIPYAQPPIGNLRWKAPQPVTPWSNTVPKSTIDMPPMCPQRPSTIPADESCLFVNVFRPASDTVLPVIVWIHGGGFWEGSLAVYPAETYALAANVVVVSIQYRLGALGFLALDEFATGNANGYVFNQGTRDQTMALKWVADNAHVFGGDPSHVLVTGESAGGHSVLLQTLQMQNAGRFQAVAMQSAAPSKLSSMQRAIEFGNFVSSHSGCGTTSGQTRMDCMLAKTGAELVPGIQAAYAKFGLPGPCVDGEILPDFPMTLVRNGKFLKGLTYLFGSNQHEGHLFSFFQFQGMGPVSESQYHAAVVSLHSSADTMRLTLNSTRALYEDVRKTQGAWEAYAKMIAGYGIRCGIADYADYISADKSVAVYRYLFKQYVRNRNEAPLGATHAAEIPFVFNSANVPLQAGTHNFSYGGNAALSVAINEDFANLARTLGAPRAGWPRYDSTNRLVRVYDALSTPGMVLLTDTSLFYDDCSVWRGVIDPTVPCDTHGSDFSACQYDEACQVLAGSCVSRYSEIPKMDTTVIIALFCMVVVGCLALGAHRLRQYYYSQSNNTHVQLSHQEQEPAPSPPGAYVAPELPGYNAL